MRRLPVQHRRLVKLRLLLERQPLPKQTQLSKSWSVHAAGGMSSERRWKHNWQKLSKTTMRQIANGVSGCELHRLDMLDSLQLQSSAMRRHDWLSRNRCVKQWKLLR